MAIYRHGDVALTAVDKLPKGAKKIAGGSEYVVAEGEVTGHAHRVKAAPDLFVDGSSDRPSYIEAWEFGGVRFLVVNDTPAEITHEEHGSAVIAPGIYKIRIQKEHDPFAGRIREVSD